MSKQKYTRYGIFSTEEVLPYVGDRKPKREYVLDNGQKYLIKMDSLRLRTFKEYGTKCVHCGIEGKFFALELQTNRNDGCVIPHFNLYGVNESGEEVMITKDHITARSKGGKNTIENMQPMCIICNSNKGSISNDEFLSKKVEEER